MCGFRSNYNKRSSVIFRKVISYFTLYTVQVALLILHLDEQFHIERFIEIEQDNHLQYPVAIYKSRN